MNDDWTQPEPIDTSQGHRLAEELGEFLLAFSKLEGLLAFSNSMLLFRDTRHESEGRIIAVHMGFRQKVDMFQMLCNHIALDEAANFLGTETYGVKQVVSSLREAGKARNRYAHDEIEASSTVESATVFKPRRKGDPHGEGWLNFIEPEDVSKNRKIVDDARQLLNAFTLAADKNINPRT